MADLWADEAAIAFGLQRIRIPAAWYRRDGSFNRGAGHARNPLIESDSTRCVVAYASGGETAGSGGCAQLFKDAGKLVHVLEWGPPW